VFFRKDKFELKDRLWAAAVRFTDGEAPAVYLIPSTAWKEPAPPFTSRNYDGRESAPEYGLSLAKKHARVLAQFEFRLGVGGLRGG
jgi:hypothetical protein